MAGLEEIVENAVDAVLLTDGVVETGLALADTDSAKDSCRRLLVGCDLGVDGEFSKKEEDTERSPLLKGYRI